MDENRSGQVRHRLGMSRRDLIRRGAIVGGTLIWTIPAIKTINSAQAAGSPTFTCCICVNPQGVRVHCQPTATTAAACASACRVAESAVTRYEFHTGPTSFTCKDTGAPAGRGCSA